MSPAPNQPFKLTPCAAALLLALSASAQAQPTELETVTVSATRSGAVAGESAQKITVISREEIERQLALSSDPSDVLGNLIPSYTPGRQKLSSAGETFRGRNPLFMIDGVPQSNPLRDGKREAYTIDLSMVERIEVIHGASAEQGLGATGGIINFVTRRAKAGAIHQHAGVSMTSPTDGGSEGLGHRVDYHIDGTHGNWDYLVGISRQARGLYYDAQGTPIGVDNTQGDTMDSKSQDVLVKIGYAFDDNQHLGLSTNHFILKGNGDYINVPGDADRGIPATSRRGRIEGKAPKNDVQTSNLTYSHANFAGGELNVQLYSQRFRALYGGAIDSTFQDPRIAPLGTLFDQSQNESEKLGTKITLKREGLFDNLLALTGGLDALQDSTRQMLAATNREWVPETKFLNYAPFIQAELRPLKHLKLQGGLRHEYAKLDVKTFKTIWSTNNAGGVTVQGGSPTFQETLLNAGLVWEATDWAQFFANYSEGFGMPDVGRVLRSIKTPGQNVGKFLDLKPIVTSNREVGIRIKNQSIDLDFSYYESNSKLGSRLVSVGGFYEVRRERTEIKGFEAGAGWKISPNQKIKASYTKSSGRSDTNADGVVDTKMDGANIAPDRIGLRWQSRWGSKLDSQLQIHHFLNRSFEKPTRQFNGYSLVDFSISYPMPVGRLTAGIENLFNRDYVTYFSQTNSTTDQALRNERYFKGRGRTITIGYQLDF